MTKRFLLGSLVLTALSIPIGCSSRPIEEPQRKNYQKVSAGLSRGEHLRVIDEDNDGLADLIGEIGYARFVAEGYEPKFSDATDAIVMSPELRNAATNELKAERELLYLMDKADYDFKKSK